LNNFYVTVVTNNNEFEQFNSFISTVDEIALDTETSGLDYLACDLFMIQIEANNKIFLFDCTKFKDITKVVSTIQDKVCVAHNAKFDSNVLYAKTKIRLKKVFCTMVAEVVLFNGLLPKQYVSYAYLVEKYFGKTINKDTVKSFIDAKLDSLSEEQLIYGAVDVQYLRDIKRQQELEAESKNLKHVLDLEMKLNVVVADMEFTGIRLDRDAWTNLEEKSKGSTDVISTDVLNIIVEKVMQREDIKTALDACNILSIPVKTKKLIVQLESITELSFIKTYLLENINLNSTKQMLAIFRNIYGLSVQDTNEKTINKYIYEYPIVKQVLDYRQGSKSTSSFGEGYLNKIHPIDGRIHTDFNQVGARSGRGASSEPNMQNIKGESEYRSAFIPSEDFLYACADYSSVEMRIMASACGEPTLIEAFNKNLDPHRFTASQIYGKPYDEITKEERRNGKTLNFAIIYGSSEFGLYRNFGIPLDIGKDFIKKYYEAYSNYAKFTKIVGDKILKTLYTVTLFGRKRFFSRKILYTNFSDKYREDEQIKRQGRNTIIQGTCADIIKIAMCDIYYNNPFGSDKLKIILQVHDELLCEVHKSIAEEGKKFIESCMLNAERKFLHGVDSAIEIVLDTKWAH
jgi:DNA polymerase I